MPLNPPLAMSCVNTTVMSGKQDVAPGSTAERVALWRALHVEVDPPPHVLEDQIGLKLLAPGKAWRRRGDMDPQFTRPFRASIVARARFIEDLVVEQPRRRSRQLRTAQARGRGAPYDVRGRAMQRQTGRVRRCETRDSRRSCRVRLGFTRPTCCQPSEAAMRLTH
jgi:hypothetical protein